LFAREVSEHDVQEVVRVLGRMDPALVENFREAVGRQIYNQFTTDGRLSTTKILQVLKENAGKVSAVMGHNYIRNIKRLVTGIRLNEAGLGGAKLGKTTPFGLALRAVITPPLTKRGRLQTLAEAIRFNSMNEFLNRAVRDPKVLQKFVDQGAKDIRNLKVINLFSQYNAVTALTLMDDAELMNSGKFGTFVDGRQVPNNPDAQVVRRK